MRALALLLLWAASASAGAAATEHGHERESCDGPEWRCAREATATFAGDGAVWLAWTSDRRVFVARSADLGRSFSAPREVSRQAVKLDHSADTRPQIIVDSRGRVTVGFAVMTDVPFKGDVLIAQSADGLSEFTEPRSIARHEAGKRFLSLALDPAGRPFASWIDKQGLEAAQGRGDDYAGAAVVAAWSDDGGASFGKPLIVQEHTCECCRVAVGFVAPGKPVVLWRNLFGAARDHALATFAAPASVGPPRRISRDDWEIDVCPHHGPALAIAADGTYHVAWFTASAVRSGLFYARSTNAGESFTAPQAIGEPGRQPARPQLLALDAKLWLAWREFDGEVTEVIVMVSGDGGRNWSPRQVVGRTSAGADHPLLVSDGRRAFVSWLTRREGYRLLPLTPGGEAS